MANQSAVAEPQGRTVTWSTLLGFGVSILLLFLATRSVEWSRFWESLQVVRGERLVAGFAFALVAVMAMAYRWRLLLRDTVAVAPSDAFDFTSIGFLAGLVIPQRLGDVVKVVLLARSHGVSRTTVLGTVVLERLTDVMLLLALAAAFAVTVRLPILFSTGLAVLAAATTVAVILLRGRWMRATAAAVTRWLPARPASVFQRQFDKLAEGARCIHSGRQFGQAIAWAASVWLCSGISMTAYIWGFDLDVPWYAGFLVILMTNLGGILPSSPGAVGVYHYMTVLALGVMSVDRTSALSFAIVTHALSIVLMIGTGTWALARQGLSLRSLREGLRWQNP